LRRAESVFYEFLFHRISFIKIARN
jgi:hypothetical protein